MNLRLVSLVFAAVVLSACGFHLRNQIKLPPDLGPVKVVSTAQYSPLPELVARGLRISGATIADDDAKGVATLQILSERWGDQAVAVDEQGRAQEYSLRYAAVFVLRRADGGELVKQQAVELARDYTEPPQDVTGTNTEREILADEMRKDMADAILRRVDSVLVVLDSAAPASIASPAAASVALPAAASVAAPAGP